jgi:ankyrin repeat protein
MTGIAPQGGCLDFLTYEYLEKQEMEKAFVLAGATGEVGTIRSFLTLLKETYLLGTYIDRCLINAANNGHLHIIEFFHNTLYPKPFYMYDRLLIDATQNNHQNVVNFLLQQNTSMSHESYRAFRYAVRYRYHEIVKTFLANGLDPNILYGIALNEASVNCDLPLVKILVEAGADVNAGKYKAEDIRSETALETAARKRCIDLVKYLVEHGAAITNRALEGTDLDIAYYLVSKRDKLY